MTCRFTSQAKPGNQALSEFSMIVVPVNWARCCLTYKLGHSTFASMRLTLTLIQQTRATNARHRASSTKAGTDG